MDPLLSVKNIQKTYGQFTLGPVSLEVSRGCIVGLIGENGAGKTTLLRAIMGLIRVEGEISVLPDTPAGRDVRQDLGVVLGNRGIPERFTTEQVEQIMAATYDNWDETLFNKYSNRLYLPEKTKYKDFPDGAKMKLALAIALSHHPRLLILDEPAAGLDPIARDQLRDLRRQ